MVRVGTTVRKPVTPATPAVAGLLHHLAAAGFDGAPRHLGLDRQGRQILKFVPGVTADRPPPITEAQLTRLGQLIRRLHDITATLGTRPEAVWEVAIPADRDELICHHALAPWNLVCDGDRWVFIDWDGAGPRLPVVGPPATPPTASYPCTPAETPPPTGTVYEDRTGRSGGRPTGA